MILGAAKKTPFDSRHVSDIISISFDELDLTCMEIFKIFA